MMAAVIAHRILTEAGPHVEVAVRRLFALQATILKEAQVLCCSSSSSSGGTDGSSSSSSSGPPGTDNSSSSAGSNSNAGSSSSSTTTTTTSDSTDWFSRAIAALGYVALPGQHSAELLLLLEARWLAVVGNILCSSCSSTEWADQEAAEGAGRRLVNGACIAVGECDVLLREVQLPGEAAAAAEAAQQLQQQAAGLLERLQHQHQLLQQEASPADTAAEGTASSSTEQSAAAVAQWSRQIVRRATESIPR
jgi:hypothetical protein